MKYFLGIVTLATRTKSNDITYVYYTTHTNNRIEFSACEVRTFIFKNIVTKNRLAILKKRMSLSNIDTLY